MPVATVIQDGDRQKIELPEGYRFDATEVLVKRDGDSLVLIPVDEAWRRFRRSIGSVSDDFMQDRDQGEHQDRGEIFD